LEAQVLRERTVFVIGAGAGRDIDMPVGSALSATIADKTNIKFSEMGRRLDSGDHRIVDALKRIAKERSEDWNLWRAAGCDIHNGLQYTRSIDAYLSTHNHDERLKVSAKLAIVRAILEAEKDSAVAKVANGEWKDREKVRTSWLPDFVHVLQDGVSASRNLKNIFDNFCIVNFNYDRCIETFLFYALKDLFRKSDDEIGELVRSLEIFHPYGQVGFLPWQNKGRAVSFGADEYGDILGLSDEIRTFNEQIGEGDALKDMHEWVASAQRFIFLGFHFHTQNMELMKCSLPQTGSRPMIYATVLDRSGPDVSMIQRRIEGMLGQGRTAQGIETVHFDCKRMFVEYGATWMS
jgi:hypothetical protein